MTCTSASYIPYTQSPPECSSNPHSPIQLTAFRQLMVAVPPPPHGHKESVALPSAAKYRDLRDRNDRMLPCPAALHFLTLILFVHVPAAPHRSHRPRHPSRLTRLSSRGGESLSLSLRDRCGTERTVTKLFHYFHYERHNKYATHFYHLLSCHIGYNFITSVIFVETSDIIDIIICMSISTYIY